MIVRSTGHSTVHFLWHERVHDFLSLEAALRFLDDFKGDPASMAQLRSLLAEHSGAEDLWRIPDEQVLQRAGRLLVGRELLVGIEWRGRLPAVATEDQPPAQAAAPAPPAPATEVEDPATFSSTHDGATQAAALRNAAATGMPFCEECERAAREGG